MSTSRLNTTIGTQLWVLTSLGIRPHLEAGPVVLAFRLGLVGRHCQVRILKMPSAQKVTTHKNSLNKLTRARLSVVSSTTLFCRFGSERCLSYSSPSRFWFFSRMFRKMFCPQSSMAGALVTSLTFDKRYFGCVEKHQALEPANTAAGRVTCRLGGLIQRGLFRCL